MRGASYSAEPPLGVNDLLNAYHHDQPLQFLAAALITISIVAAAVCVIRKRFDPPLVFLALFANIYAQHLRFESHVFLLTTAQNEFAVRLRAAISYVVPILAFAFFEAAGFLGRKGKTVVVAVTILYVGLVLGVLVVGPRREFDFAADWIFIFAVLAVGLRSQLLRNQDTDFSILRIGILCFSVSSIWDNVAGLLSSKPFQPLSTTPKIEPFGVAILLAALGYITARRLVHRDNEQREMQMELELAQRIQLSILPTAFPESQYFRAAASYVPMTSVAGDFYDFLNPDSSTVGLLVADVSGHGVPAALIASMVKIAATSQRAYGRDPAELLTRINTALCGNTQNQFVTAAYVCLDAKAQEFRYAAAGHPAMLLLRHGGVTKIVENGLILAITGAATYTQVIQPLEPGDRLILYTDGILEASNSRGEFFGEEHLYDIVKRTATLSPTAAVQGIVDAVQRWAPRQEDDLTLVVCDFLSAP